LEIPENFHQSIHDLLNRCWQYPGDDRPNAKEAGDVIDNVLIESTLVDHDSSNFWKTHFRGESEIPFHIFAQKLFENLGIPFPRDIEMDKNVDFKCLREMVATKKSDDTLVVRLEDLSLFIRRFGPLFQENGVIEVLKELMSCSWFCGDVNGGQAANILKRMKKPGYYMVRHSNSNPDQYVLVISVNYKADKGKDLGIEHIQIITEVKDNKIIYSDKPPSDKTRIEETNLKIFIERLSDIYHNNNDIPYKLTRPVEGVNNFESIFNEDPKQDDESF